MIRRPNVLLIVMDATRLDYLFGLRVDPRLDSIAES